MRMKLPANIDLVNSKFRVRKCFQGKRVVQYFDSLPDAEQCLHELAQRERLSKLGLSIDFTPQFFGEFSSRYFNLHLPEWSENTQLLYKRILEDLNRFFSHCQMHQIHAEEIFKTLHHLKKKHDWSNATFNRYHSFLKQLFQAGIDQRPSQCLRDNPLNQVKRLVEAQVPRVIFETTEQMQAFLTKAHEIDPTYWIAITILLNTGIRKGELLGLTYQDVKLTEHGGTLTINKQRHGSPTKTKHHRVVTFGPDLAQALKHWLTYAPGQPYQYLIALTPSALTRFHKECLMSLGLPNVTLHGLRHTYASHTLKLTNNLRELQSQLGHTQYSTTLRYTQSLNNKFVGLSIGGSSISTGTGIVPININRGKYDNR